MDQPTAGNQGLLEDDMMDQERRVGVAAEKGNRRFERFPGREPGGIGEADERHHAVHVHGDGPEAWKIEGRGNHQDDRRQAIRR